MININNKKIMQYILNKKPKSINNGDIIQYSLMRQIDKNKAIINIMGNKVTAIFKNEIVEKGFALVEKNQNNILTLNLIKNAKNIEEAKENIKKYNIINDHIDIQMDNDDITTLLISKNIKPNETNIKYIETILKYFPNINNNKKNFILNAISNDIYFTIEELRNLENVFDNLISIKNSNRNNKITEILSTILDNNEINIKDYVDSNGYFGILTLIFDKIKEELSYDKKKSFIFLLKLLSSNRKKRSVNETTFFIPIPILINNEIKELSLYIFKDYNNNTKFIFIVYDDNKNEICNIDIKKEYDYYIIRVLLFDKSLYYKLKEINIYSKLQDFENIKLEMEYYEKQE